MSTKYFIYPFGVSGTRASVPNGAQMDGTVSYEEGFPVGYQLDYSDPASLNVPRDQFNQALYDVTLAIKQIQEHGFPEFITSAMNGGSPFGYDINACVYQPADGNNYCSLISSNTDVPPSINWRLVTFATGIPAAVGMEYWGTSLPSGWLWQNGLTIGNASSNATARANADTADLFAVLWALPSTTFQLYTSGGSPTTRGVSAAADFAANRAIALPDTRERVVAGAGTMGGTSDPGRITTGGAGFSGTVVGANGGLETVQLTANQNGTHTHTGSTSVSGTHGHTGITLPMIAVPGQGGKYPINDKLTVARDTQGTSANIGVNNPFPGTVESTIYSTDPATVASTNSAHSHSMSLNNSGLGSAHQNTQPTIICNKIIKL